MAATSWRSAAAACWAGLLLLAFCNSEQQPSVLEAHRQTLLDSAQQLEAAAAPTQYFSKEFPHGSGATAGRSWIDFNTMACCHMGAGAWSGIWLASIHCTLHAAGETRLEKHDDLDYDVYHHLWSAHSSWPLSAVSTASKAVHLVDKSSCRH
jgi:hypothetical protein